MSRVVVKRPAIEVAVGEKLVPRRVVVERDTPLTRIEALKRCVTARRPGRLVLDSTSRMPSGPGAFSVTTMGVLLSTMGCGEVKSVTEVTNTPVVLGVEVEPSLLVVTGKVYTSNFGFTSSVSTPFVRL